LKPTADQRRDDGNPSRKLCSRKASSRKTDLPVEFAQRARRELGRLRDRGMKPPVLRVAVGVGDRPRAARLALELKRSRRRRRGVGRCRRTGGAAWRLECPIVRVAAGLEKARPSSLGLRIGAGCAQRRREVLLRPRPLGPPEAPPRGRPFRELRREPTTRAAEPRFEPLGVAPALRRRT
jgi:hypothetical protein